MRNNVSNATLKVASGAKVLTKVALAFTVAFVCSNAFALNGGFDTVSTDTSEFQKWLYRVVGVVALAYLSWIGIKIKAQKATWSDFGVGLIHVAVAGGAVTAGTYFYGLFA